MHFSAKGFLSHSDGGIQVRWDFGNISSSSGNICFWSEEMEPVAQSQHICDCLSGNIFFWNMVCLRL